MVESSSSMDDTSTKTSPSLSELPGDELAAYGRELGLSVDTHTPRGEQLRLIRGRRELLSELDRAALLEVVVWARLPVRRSAGKEQLAQHIASITKTRWDDLSERGLGALARLRDVDVGAGDDRATIQRKLRHAEGLWARVTRKRRSVMGSMLSKLVEGAAAKAEYQFLPEEAGKESLRETIEDVGVVGGIAQRLRGAADHYVAEKLDEIERRIDRKLDEIDKRLGEWRDHEIANRLRLVKITLIATIIVAFISLGYHFIKARTVAPSATSIERVVHDEP